MMAKKKICRVLLLMGLLAAFACRERLNEETYDRMDGMRLHLSSALDHMQRSIELSILPPEDWEGLSDPCPELPGLQLSVDGETIATTFGGSEYWLAEGWPIPIVGNYSGPYCPYPESSYPHYLVYSSDPPTETSTIEFAYQDQLASLAINGLWSTPYWDVVSPHEEINDRVAISPGDLVAFELSYGNDQVILAYVDDRGVYTSTPGNPYDNQFYELVSSSYDEASRRLLVTISPEVEHGTIISMNVNGRLEWDVLSCVGWLGCEIDPYLVSARYNLVVQ